MGRIIRSDHDAFARALVAYAKDEEPEPDFVIPEDLSVLSDEELAALHEQAVAHFDTLFNDGQALSEDDVAALAVLTEGIETLLAEIDTRASAQDERNDAAAALAARAHPAEPTDEGEGEGEQPRPEDVDGAEDEQEPGEGETPAEVDAEAEGEPIAASARKRGDIRVNLSGLRSRQAGAARLPRPASEAQTMKDLVLAADVPGFVAGEGLDWDGLGRAVDRRLANYNESAYQSAHDAGRAMREQYGVALIRQPFEEGLVINSTDQTHVDEVIRRAMDESRLPGGSLVASGGWCAPSEVRYDLFEMESRDGLVSIPTIGVSRGGISFTPGPDFATIYGAVPGFHYTEANDIAGTYAVDANGTGTGSAGTKPCYKVPCPAFQEKRLELDGVCITAGLLQQRGYPEVIARTVRGALIAHDHRMSGRVLASMVAGSTTVTMTAAQVGATAPLLESIEKQVEHYRYVARMSRGTTLEGIFPFWVHGVVRSDLARRQGTDLDPLSVSDAQINAWFAQRGVNPQFVYNWQDLTGAASAFLLWPATVTFLLYAAGTWVKGGADVITVDTLYDAQQLGTNDFTALFTEEGYFVAKVGHDSRAITVALCPDGATHMGVEIKCDGTQGP